MPARHVVVSVGAAASALVAWGGCNAEFSHGPDGWPHPVIRAIGATIPTPLDWLVIVVGVVALCWCWWQLRGSTRRQLAVALALWSLPLLLVPPVLSADAVLYADLGWIVRGGGNPYVLGLTGAGGPYAPQVDPLWAGNGVAYPPLALHLDSWLVTLTQAAPYGGILAMRIPAVLSVAAFFVLLPALARRLSLDPDEVVWLGAANPLVLLHFIGGAHNDAPMVALALAGLWVAWRRPGWWWSLLAGPAVIGLAMSVKQQAGLAVVAAVGLPIAASLATLPLSKRVWSLGWRSAVAAVVAGVVFVGVSLVSGLGFGWLGWLSLMGNTGTPAPFSIIGKVGALLIGLTGADATPFLAGVAVVSGVVLLSALTWILLHFADRPLAATAWGSLAVSVLGQSLHPWYVPWSLALFALVPLSVRQFRWVIGFALAFVSWNAVQTVVWHSMP